MLDALRDNPEWRRVYLARATSLLGTWLNTLAIVHLLGRGEITEALPLAIVFVLKHAPTFVLSPAAGVVADRFDRRRIMVACDVLSAAVVLGFLLAEPGGSHVLIYALTLLQVGVVCFFDPAYRAVIPDLVQDQDLVAANALGAVTWSAMFALGTALGGVVLYAFGWELAILLDAFSYLVSAALVASVRDERTKPPERPPSVGLRALLGVDDVVGGIRYLRTDPGVRHVLFAKATWGLMHAAVIFQTLLGAQPRFRLADSGDLGISFLWFCRAIGTGLGPPVARWLGRDDPERLKGTIAMGLAFGLTMYLGVAFAGNVWILGALITLAHLGSSSVWVMSTVLLQQQVPSGFRGRTFATELGIFMLVSSASDLAYAAVMDVLGWSITSTIVLAVCVCAGPAVLWTLTLLKLRRG